MITTHAEVQLPAVIRLTDGRLVEGELPAERHRRIHIGLLHEHTTRLVELAAGRRNDNGELAIYTRKRTDHFLPGGGAGDEHWLDALLALAATHHDRGELQPEELFVAVCERTVAGGHKHNVAQTRWLWVDVDDRERLPALWAFLREPTRSLPHGRQPHLVVESAGVRETDGEARPSDGQDRRVLGGVHAYWKLAQPLHALTLRRADGSTVRNPGITKPADSDALIYTDPQTGEILEEDFEITSEIERANLRLIHALGYRYDPHGRQVPTVACVSCKERGRVLRLAGSRHGASGRYARIVFADLQRPGYRLHDLVGELPDPKDRPAVRHHTAGGPSFDDDDPYKRIPIIDVYEALTGNEGSLGHKVRCPHRDHPDHEPSCDLSDDCWICRSCGAGGGAYQLASAVLGGPTTHLRGNAFLAAKRLLVERLGDLQRQHVQAPHRHVGADHVTQQAPTSATGVLAASP